MPVQPGSWRGRSVELVEDSESDGTEAGASGDGGWPAQLAGELEFDARVVVSRGLGVLGLLGGALLPAGASTDVDGAEDSRGGADVAAAVHAQALRRVVALRAGAPNGARGLRDRRRRAHAASVL